MPFANRMSLVAVLLPILLAVPAWAQEAAAPLTLQNGPRGTSDQDGFQLRLGAGALATPDYLGSKTYKLQPLPFIDASYDDLAALSYQDGLTVNLLHLDGFTAGPAVRLRFGQDQSDNRHVLHGLGNVGTSVDVGGFAAYDAGPFTFKAVVGQDVADGDKGLESEISATYTQAVLGTSAGPWLVSAGPSVTLVDAQYNQSYFGISKAQSLRSGRAVYRPGGGVEGAGMDATLIIPITDKIAVTALAGYNRLLSDAANSPIVRGGVGSANQVTGGLFVSYQLY